MALQLQSRWIIPTAAVSQHVFCRFESGMDERTQFEMYYPPFEGANRCRRRLLIMCSHNTVCVDCDLGLPRHLLLRGPRDTAGESWLTAATPVEKATATVS